jgi:hypothetical protein
VSQCKDLVSGGMIDNLITSTPLPVPSRHFVKRAMEKLETMPAAIDVRDGVFACEVG